MKLRRRARGNVDFGGDNCDTITIIVIRVLQITATESVAGLVVSLY